MSETSEKLRAEFLKSDTVRDAGLTTPDDIVRFDDIQYGIDSKWQILDVYRPKREEGKELPVIVSIHGGGWVYGDKERYQFYCMSLAQRGFAVVNFTYRLAPDFKFPAPIEDSNSVFTWILAHAKEYGFDTDHIFAVGDSAGGQQLGIYANILTNPEYRARFPFEVPAGLSLKAIALNCGHFHTELPEGRDDLTSLLMADYMPNKGDEEELLLVSVEDHITSNFPPTFLMTATGDFLQDQPDYLIQKFREKKVPFLFRFYGDKEHELGHVFHCNIRLPEAKLCNDDECEFFHKYM